MWTLRALRVASILTPVTPAAVGYLLCRIAAVIFFLVNGWNRRQVIDNLQHVDPNMGWLGYRIAAFKVFETVFANYYDLLRFRTVDHERFRDLIDVQGRENLDAAMRSGKGVIILTAHLGNYSVVGQYPATIGIRSAIIAERVQPPGLFNFMMRLRSASGIDVFPPGREAIPPIVRLLRGNGILLVAGDRDISGQGVTVDFFGEPATLPAGPALLAMRTGAALIPAYTIRTSTRHSIGIIEPPLQLVRSHNREADLRHNVQLVAHALERMIRADPTQWAVLQRVWGAPPTRLQQRGEGLGSVPSGISEQREPARAMGDAEHQSESAATTR
ncbi:MAG TPA: lysophospholipid acyltransferase family protein [Nitrolancea sp.]|nr:lysophospholipid acyltransferase family protein [Nitrolancea sp.]